MTEARQSRAWLRTAILFVASFAAYATLLQSQPYGDGISYLTWLRDEEFLAHHLFYLPPMWLFARFMEVFGLSERTAAFLFSAFCAAVGNGVLCWLLSTSKRLAAQCSCPLLLTLLAVTAPSVLFFGTQIENHAHHYMWICITLLALDRGLDAYRASWSRATVTWSVAGLCLLGAFSSHSSSVLLWPALAWLTWSFTRDRERLFRMPDVADVRAFALFFGPSIVFKLVQPSIKVWISGDPNWGDDSTAAFAFSLLGLRDFVTWMDYVWAEVILPAWGLVWAVVVLGVRRLSGHRRESIVAILALAPYLAFFGSWNVREFGAYYLPLLPFFVVGAAHLMPRLRKEEALVLALLIVGQGVHGILHTRSWVETRENPPWTWADDAVRVAGKGGAVLCWEGVRWLHIDYDHEDVECIAFHNWTLTLSGPASEDPDFWRKVADNQLVALIQKAHAAGGRVAVARELFERFENDKSLAAVRPIETKLRAMGLEEVERGAFRGWLVKK